MRNKEVKIVQSICQQFHTLNLTRLQFSGLKKKKAAQSSGTGKYSCLPFHDWQGLG